jgi:hypothetical protein
VDLRFFRDVGDDHERMAAFGAAHAGGVLEVSGSPRSEHETSTAARELHRSLSA